MSEAPKNAIEVKLNVSGAPLPVWRKLGWAAGDSGINLFWGMIGTFLFFFYTEVMQIPAHWAGIAFAIASIWDGLTDPIMGAIADRTRSRFGRFRPWLLYLSLPTAISFVLVFSVPPLTGSWLIAYAIATHVVFRTCFTGISIPFSAMSSTITTDSQERSALAGMRMFFAGMGGMCVAFAVPRIVEASQTPATGYFVASVSLGIAALILLLVSFLSSKEAPQIEIAQADDKRFFSGFISDARAFWGMLLVNGPLARLFASVILSSIMVSMYSKALLYWIKYDLEDMSVMGWLLPLGALIVVAASPIWAQVSRLISKRSVFLVGVGLSVLAIGAFYVLNPRDHKLLMVLTIIGSLGASAKFVMFWSMLPDTVEFQNWRTGVSSSAKIFGFATFGQKVALAINAVAFGYLLTAVGYVADVPPTPEVKRAILAIMCLIPILGSLISAAFIWGYPISRSFHARIKLEIEERGKAV
ncbi:MAG TPA: glycoside-pentoside-hexuronide (GPH):cation symporter [Hyphomonas sp.]|nr:glycoside-pentoside-hexuronide (GPH):cation symporter [Hyphomonas sp.]HRK67140.1 glycoside-pentoside-hexuronide (GPH):cation symporter [Hyphomonas sp.]